jgi:hypothetical protein
MWVSRVDFFHVIHDCGILLRMVVLIGRDGWLLVCIVAAGFHQ